jgi:glyoxylase-like metal-dependent hydrolase (beta-lactamase superfamily II)
LTLHQTGGHFPGSAVVHWAAGAGGRGVLLTGDSVYPNPDRCSISFMRSYPNHLPLSGTVALRIAAQLGELKFDRIYGNFNNVIASQAQAILHDSAQRHAAWARGDFDHMT